MNSKRNRWSLTTLTTTILLLAGLALTPTALAQDPTPTPTPTPTPEPPSLAEAARQAAPQGGADDHASKTPLVISDANLAEYAAKGALTEVTRSDEKKAQGERRPAHSSHQARGIGASSPESAAEDRAEQDKREYWRRQYKTQKELVESLKAEVERLDSEIPGLWFDFYRWDDPMYRDGVIKAKIDRSVSRRETLVKRLPLEEARLEEIQVAARRDGALPGWFRDLQ